MADAQSERLPPGPYQVTQFSTETEKLAFAATLEEQGIRLLPYPFDAALAIASDVDQSQRQSYEAYVGLLVALRGFDFGDSIWLHWRYGPGERYLPNSRGFFSPNLTVGREEPTQLFERVPTFIETIADFHRGNIDHFHALLPHGPRAAVFDRFDSGAAMLSAEIPTPQLKGRWAGIDCHVFAIEVQGAPGCALGEFSVAIECHGGELYDAYEADKSEALAGNIVRFLTLPAAASAVKVPRLLDAARVIVKCDDPGQLDQIAYVILYSTSGRLILDRLDVLRSEYGVSFNLITEHAALHFRTPEAARGGDRLNAEHFAAGDTAGSAYNGGLTDQQGRLIFCTDADHPGSIARIMPKMVDAFDLRYVVPLPAISSDGLSILDVMSPSRTRSGGGVYWANRVQPHASEPPPGHKFDGKTRQDTFAARVDKALATAVHMPGTFWPIYTHLGGVVYGADRKVPDPYFDEASMHRLQQAAFGLGSPPPATRMWTARASVLYDYALVVRSIASHIDRRGDAIHIASWHDPVLGYDLPISAEQLYGVTFYVEDARRASVHLNGAEIRDIARNAPDQTGQPSVTVFASGIEYVVFNRLDPREMAGASLASGTWSWLCESESGQAFGRLSASAATAGELRLAISDSAPLGAQALRFRLRRGVNGTRAGVVLKSASGASFSFGDHGLSAHCVSEAHYAVDPDDSLQEVWETIVVPFSALRWSEDATGADMPSHWPMEISLRVEGGDGASADFADLAFLRPRCLPRQGTGHVLIGICEDRHDIPVMLATPDGTIETRTDQRGWFCFSGLASGVYQLWACDGDILLERKAGRKLEVINHRADIVLIAQPRASST